MTTNSFGFSIDGESLGDLFVTTASDNATLSIWHTSNSVGVAKERSITVTVGDPRPILFTTPLLGDRFTKIYECPTPLRESRSLASRYRLCIRSAWLSRMSMQWAIRPFRTAAASVVPLPPNGSRTVPPGGQQDLMKNSGRDSGKGASFSWAS